MFRKNSSRVNKSFGWSDGDKLGTRAVEISRPITDQSWEVRPEGVSL